MPTTTRLPKLKREINLINFRENCKNKSAKFTGRF